MTSGEIIKLSCPVPNWLKSHGFHNRLTKQKVILGATSWRFFFFITKFNDNNCYNLESLLHSNKSNLNRRHIYFISAFSHSASLGPFPILCMSIGVTTVSSVQSIPFNVCIVICSRSNRLTSFFFVVAVFVSFFLCRNEFTICLNTHWTNSATDYTKETSYICCVPLGRKRYQYNINLTKSIVQ